MAIFFFLSLLVVGVNLILLIFVPSKTKNGVLL